MRQSTVLLQAGATPGADNSVNVVRNSNSPPGIGDHPAPGESYPDDLDIQIATCIKNTWAHEDAAYRPILARSMEAYNLYNNTYVIDQAKDDWQSRMKMPYCFMTVERWVAALIKMLESGSSWLETESVVPQLQIFHNLCKNLLMFLLQHDMSRFFPMLREALKTGLLSSMMHVMVTYEVDGLPVATQPLETDEADILRSVLNDFSQPDPAVTKSEDHPFLPNPLMPKPVFKIIPSSVVRLDSSGAGRYKMWRTKMSVAEIRATGAQRGYDMTAVERAIFAQTENKMKTDYRHRVETGLAQGLELGHQPWTVELTHFEGTLEDNELGQQVFKNKYVVVANDMEVILGPIDSPFWDGQSALVSSPFIQSPNSVYGKSPIMEAVDAFFQRHNFGNSLNDYLVRSMNPPYQVDEDVLAKSELVEELILYPARRINVSANGNPNANAIRPVPQAELPQGLWQYLQWYQTQMSEVTGMTQELMGMPRTRGRITGQEYASRSAEAGNWLAFVFSDIEDQFLTPFIRVFFLRTLQMIPDPMWKAWVVSNIPRILPESDQTPPVIKEAWTKQLMDCAEWDAKKRYMNLGGFFKFRVKIFSNFSERQMEVEKGTFMLNVLSKMPQMMQYINIPEFVRYIVRAFGWDPERILNKTGLPMPDAKLLSEDQSPDGVLAKLRQFMSQGPEQNQPLQAPNLYPDVYDMFGMGGQSQQDQSGSPFPGGPHNPSPSPPNPPSPPGQ